MNNTDKIIQALLKNKDSGSSGSGASADVVTSETLENELKAQQARIEKTFKDELKKLQENFNNISKEKEKENNEDNLRKHERSSRGQEAEIPDDSGTENDSDKGAE